MIILFCPVWKTMIAYNPFYVFAKVGNVNALFRTMLSVDKECNVEFPVNVKCRYGFLKDSTSNFFLNIKSQHTYWLITKNFHSVTCFNIAETWYFSKYSTHYMLHIIKLKWENRFNNEFSWNFKAIKYNFRYFRKLYPAPILIKYW